MYCFDIEFSLKWLWVSDDIEIIHLVAYSSMTEKLPSFSQNA
ncbi:hypothetical protein SOHN41_02716 [Shewanella sp. HN-41]|nr:hypothetical protein SOHN41_02716 [Shewanella sp. HN-41]